MCGRRKDECERVRLHGVCEKESGARKREREEKSLGLDEATEVEFLSPSIFHIIHAPERV